MLLTDFFIPVPRTVRTRIWDSGPGSRLMGDYTYKWITVNGVKCVQVDYKRTGSNYDMYNPVICRIAIFQNNNEMVVMILSYREKEAGLWKADFEKVFRSFKWI